MKPIVAAMVTTAGDDKRARRFRRMAAVWEYSAHQVFGESATIVCRRAPELDLDQPCPIFTRGKKEKREIGPEKTLAWREKIRHWAAIVRKAPAGTPVLLTDIDMIFFKNPFPDVLTVDGGFDVGLCRQSTGAVYLSGSPGSHSFMESWLQATERLFENEKLYRTLDATYLGLDQCSFQLAVHGDTDAKIADLPARFHSTTQWHEHPCYLFHIHSVARGGALGYTEIEDIAPDLRPYCLAWQEIEAQLSRD